MANEKRLIDAKDFDLRVAKKRMTEVFPNWKELPREVQDAVCKHAQYLHRQLETQPTVDAVEVVHGHWIDSHTVDHIGRIIEHGIDCSVCDSVFKDDSREVVKRWKERFKVCPFCGAIMDGGNEDDL